MWFLKFFLGEFFFGYIYMDGPFWLDWAFMCCFLLVQANLWGLFIFILILNCVYLILSCLGVFSVQWIWFFLWIQKFLFYFIECGHCSNCFLLLFFVYWLLMLCFFFCSLQSRQKAIADLHQMQNVHVSFYFSYWLYFWQVTGLLNLVIFWCLEPYYIHF